MYNKSLFNYCIIIFFHAYVFVSMEEKHIHGYFFYNLLLYVKLFRKLVVSVFGWEAGQCSDDISVPWLKDLQCPANNLLNRYWQREDWYHLPCFTHIEQFNVTDHMATRLPNFYTLYIKMFWVEYVLVHCLFV